MLLGCPRPAAAADIIVQRVPGASAADVRAGADVTLVDSLPIARTQVVAPDQRQSQADAVAALNADPDVLYAEPDAQLHALSNDFYWSAEWSLSNDGRAYGGVPGDDIHAPQAWP